MTMDNGGALGSRYVLTERIGQGGMGVVWRALDRETGVERAVKVLRGELAQDPDALTRFVRERTALLRLRHPGVVTVHDMIVEGDRLALVMDLVTGEDLGDYRRRRGGTLPPAEAAWLVAQVCEALVAVHATGLVHRDLKPANVLLDHGRGGEHPVRLADFGVAHIVSGPELTVSGQLIGTPSFMAPEVLRGQALSPAADVYAAGVTLYELLAGRRPFQGDDISAVMRGHLEDAPPPIPGVPDALWALLAQSLTKDPAPRLGAAALAHGLRAYANAHRTVPFALTPLPARPATAPPRPPEFSTLGGPTLTGPPAPSRKGPLLLGVGSVIAAAALATGVTLTLTAGGDPENPQGTPMAQERQIAAAKRGASPTGKPTAKASGRQPRTASPTPSSPSAKPTKTRAKPKATGWLCGPRTAVDKRPHYMTACIRTDGERVYLKATGDPVASRNDPKLIASNRVTIVLVLKTADTQKSVQYFTSPVCRSVVCTYEASTVPPHHAYRTLPKFYYQGVYQGAGHESPTIDF